MVKEYPFLIFSSLVSLYFKGRIKVNVLSKDIYVHDLEYRFTTIFYLEQSMSFYEETKNGLSDHIDRGSDSAL